MSHCVVVSLWGSFGTTPTKGKGGVEGRDDESHCGCSFSKITALVNDDSYQCKCYKKPALSITN